MNVLTSLIASHKGDSLDVFVIADEVDSVLRSVDNIEHACRDTSLLSKLCKDHGRTGVLLGWLDDAGVSNDIGEWEHPKRDHSGKVEGCDTSNNTKRFTDGVSVHIGGNFEMVAHDHMRKGAGSLNDLQTSENITTGISESLALLQSD